MSLFVVTAAGCGRGGDRVAAGGYQVIPGADGERPGGSDLPRVHELAFFGDGRGWIVTDEGVLHTPDRGREWRRATPPEIRPEPLAPDRTFFFDGRRAWRLGFLARQPSQAVLDTTSDGGSTWSRHTVRLDFRDQQPGGTGMLFFLDEHTGWLLGRAQTSSAASRGVLYRTSDGGATWTRLSAPIAGTIRFATPSRGWVAGGPAGGELYVTGDGGATWEAVNVPQRSADQPWRTTVAAPFVIDEDTAVLPVQVSLFSLDGDVPQRRERTDPTVPTLDAGPDSGSDLHFFVTDDAGATWTPAGAPLRTAQLGDIFYGAAPRLSIVDREHWFLAAAGLWATSDGGRSWAQVDSDRDLSDAIRTSFVSPLEGWLYLERTGCPEGARETGASCTVEAQLLHTTDGGGTWEVVGIR